MSEETGKEYTSVAIKTCLCVNAYQDATYGKNKRVHNKGGAIGKAASFTCTVCGSVKA
jgi:hypothetical protein